MSGSVASQRPVSQRLGRYEVLLPREDDGFASLCVARARGRHVGPATVELACIDRGLSREAEIRAAFLAEGKAAARIHHVNFVQPLDAFLEDGRLYAATEFVLGVRLQDVLDACRRTGTPIPVGIASRITLDVLAGLSAVHVTALPGATARPLVHGDITPHNVVVSYRGVARLVHSGLSAAACRIGIIDRTNRRLAYKAPEQLRAGLGDVPIGSGADLFAVGALLWEMLAGERLFEAGTDLEIVDRVLHAPIPSPGERSGVPIPEDIATLVSIALDRRADRPTTSAADFGDALECAAASVLASDEEVALLIDSLLGAEIEQLRETIDDRTRAVDSSANPDASGIEGGDAPPPRSSISLSGGSTASSGRLRASPRGLRAGYEAAPRSRGSVSTRPSPGAPSGAGAENSTQWLGANGWQAAPVPARGPAAVGPVHPRNARRGRAKLGWYVAVGALLGALATLLAKAMSGPPPAASDTPAGQEARGAE